MAAQLVATAVGSMARPQVMSSRQTLARIAGLHRLKLVLVILLNCLGLALIQVFVALPQRFNLKPDRLWLVRFLLGTIIRELHMGHMCRMRRFLAIHRPKK